MGLRIGFGFRIARHVGIYASVPLFRHHAQRIAAHQGHANPPVIDQVLAFLFLCWLVGKCTGGPDAG
jgi:hypothetical protein